MASIDAAKCDKARVFCGDRIDCRTHFPLLGGRRRPDAQAEMAAARLTSLIGPERERHDHAGRTRFDLPEHLTQRKFAVPHFPYGAISPPFGALLAPRAFSHRSDRPPQGLRRKESPVTLYLPLRTAALAAILAAGGVTGVAAQTTADPHHPGATFAQITPPAAPRDMTGQGQGAQPGMMPPGMMGPGMMGGMPMMGGMMGPGMAGQMRMMGHGHAMKIMFAIADADGDGALSFEEVTLIHKRIFDKVDADKDGKVTLEEVRAFLRE